MTAFWHINRGERTHLPAPAPRVLRQHATAAAAAYVGGGDVTHMLGIGERGTWRMAVRSALWWDHTGSSDIRA